MEKTCSTRIDITASKKESVWLKPLVNQTLTRLLDKILGKDILQWMSGNEKRPKWISIGFLFFFLEMTSSFAQEVKTSPILSCLPGSRPLYEISANINVQLEVTSNPRSPKTSSWSGTFQGPPESVGARPARCRLPPRSAPDERFCSLASDKQHESSTVSRVGNRYEQVCQMCKSV